MESSQPGTTLERLAEGASPSPGAPATGEVSLEGNSMNVETVASRVGLRVLSFLLNSFLSGTLENDFCSIDGIETLPEIKRCILRSGVCGILLLSSSAN